MKSLERQRSGAFIAERPPRKWKHPSAPGLTAHRTPLGQTGSPPSDRPARAEKAIALASEHQLVTPVTGAVVLETQEQYMKWADPSALDAVPSIPEPSTWLPVWGSY